MKIFTIFFLVILTQFSCKSNLLKEKKSSEIQESADSQLILETNTTIPHDQKIKAYEHFLWVISASFLICFGLSLIKSKNRVKKSS